MISFLPARWDEAYKAGLLKLDRKQRIAAGIEKADLGIEVAPWFNPIIRKAHGYSLRIVDVFDRPTLIKRGLADPNISNDSLSLLEEVDYVGSATELINLVPQTDHGKFKYVISSHNFEHLPNPIKFLRACEELLENGGIVSMAIPDSRATFDYFRPLTTIADWITWWQQDLKKPSAQILLHAEFLRAEALGVTESQPTGAFHVGIDPRNVQLSASTSSIGSNWNTLGQGNDYIDCHCSVLTPESFELLIFECNLLGILNHLKVESIVGPSGCEFFARLKRVDRIIPKLDDQQALIARNILYHRVLGSQMARFKNLEPELSMLGRILKKLRKSAFA